MTVVSRGSAGLADAALAELQLQSPGIYPVLKIVWPDATRYYTTANYPVSSATLGPVDALVEEWADIPRMTSDYTGPSMSCWRLRKRSNTRTQPRNAHSVRVQAPLLHRRCQTG